jgi:Protein of unknown function (DUF2946)
MGRRSLGAILFGLVMLAQSLAPVAASRMYAQGSDPFGNIPICSTDADSSTDHSAPGNIPSHHDHCPLCQIALGGWLPLDTRTVSTTAFYAETRLVPWLITGDRHIVFGVDQHRPPRGPPSLT